MTAPKIPPVPAGVDRPLWSVMVPTYNCDKYLGQALESVLAQDPGPMHMQIEVVDDCSTRDDPEPAVREVGRGRVAFFRQPRNLGMCGNLNSCVQRSMGLWVHLLNHDDYVLPGFYKRLETAMAAAPAVSLLCTRSLVVDELGELQTLSDRIPSLEVPSSDVSAFLLNNPLRTPAVVIRRSFYEASGGFDTRLCHANDWEMWLRAIRDGGGLHINEALTCYRIFSGNLTSQQMATGENLQDFLRLGDILHQSTPNFDKRAFRRVVADLALWQSRQFRAKGNLAAAAVNQQIWRTIRTPGQFVRFLASTLRKRLRL